NSMATFTKVGNKWRAQIRKVGLKSTAKTFPTKAAAMRWAMEIEDAGGGPSKLTVAEVIEKYRELKADAGRPVGKTSNTHYMLNYLASAKYELGPKRVSALGTDDLVAYCKVRLTTIENSPAGMEISLLGT